MLNRELRVWMKGVAVAAVAAHVTYWVSRSAQRWAAGARQAYPDGGAGSGMVEEVLASIVPVVVVPLILAVGMRLLRERETHILTAAGSGAWFALGAQVTVSGTSGTEREAFLAAFALLGGFLALVRLGPES
ncbi:hypothetical protein [Streptomyces sp. NPDC017529]|uniref:hypothetical protein n=1 Tax=Streptomyces sp. NPDC017529 TaxID=3365000 RepID=UPI0037BA6EC5